MSQRQIPQRAAAVLAASAGALAPVADMLARRRGRRPLDDEDDDDDAGNLLLRLRRRRRREEQEDDDDDRVGIALRARKRKDANDNDDDEEGSAGVSNQQSVSDFRSIREMVNARIEEALSDDGGGGGGSDEPNITVSEDGDALVVLTRNIEFVGDSEGFEVETSGISYSSGAGGGLIDDFES